MTANVASQAWMGWKSRKAVAGEIFKRTTADIVGFQEIGLNTWEDTFRTVRPELELVSGVALGDIVINSCAFNPSKFRLIDSSTFWLSPTGRPEAAWGGKIRGVTWLKLEDRTVEGVFLFYNIHLDNVSREAREKSIQCLFQHMKKMQPVSQGQQLPLVVVGDSNTSVDSPDQRWRDSRMQSPYHMMIRAGFDDCWRATHLEQRPHTFHGFQGSEYTPDRYGTWDTEWILVRDLCPLSCTLITDSIQGVYPSDHFWMRATVQFKTA